MDTKKILSALAAAGVLTAGVLGANVKASTDTEAEGTEYLKPVGVYKKLIEGKNVVPYVLKDKATAVTVKDVKAQFADLELVNGNAVTDESVTLGTGDTFTAGGKEYTIVVYGDANGDGIISTADALDIQKNAINKLELDAAKAEAADVANDGEVTTLDALNVQKYVVGKLSPVIDSLPPIEDEEGPVINGVVDGETFYAKLNDASFALPAVTAVDEVEGEVALTTEGEFNIAEEGSYTVKYSAEDSLGNKSEATITVVVDGTTPSSEVRYSTTVLTKDGVTVSIISNEILKVPEGWEATDDGMTIKKLYMENVENEEVTVSDLAGNETKEYITISNIDAVVNADISYDVTEPTNGVVKATITSDEEIGLVDGWAYVADSNKTAIEKSYEENVIEDVVIKDVIGNEKVVTVNIQNIDKVAPKAEVQFDVTKVTNGNVVVTLLANEALKSVSGTSEWTIDPEDNTKATATFENNAEEVVTITDLAGNEAEVPVKVSNIDKQGPELKVSYSEEDMTTMINRDITVTITANEKIKPVEGWTISEDELSLTKVFGENISTTITVEDLLGNASSIDINIANIDKEAPVVTGVDNDGSYKTATPVFEGKDVQATLEVNGVEKAYTSGTEINTDGAYTLRVFDTAGNETVINFTIDNVAPVFPEDMVTDVLLMKDQAYSTDVYANDEVDGEILAELKITDDNNSDAEVEAIDTSKDGNYTLTYTATDRAGNVQTTTVNVDVDATAAIVESLTSSTDEVTNRVTMYVTFNEEMQELEGWKTTDNKTFNKDFTANTEETVEFKDKAGNITPVVINIANIDAEGPNYTVSYSTNAPAKEVLVTITADEDLKAAPDGWNFASEDNHKVITKGYTSNAEEDVTIEDLAGNTKVVHVSVTNADSVAPTLDINYSKTEPTNGDVTVTITSNEALRPVDGWELSEDAKTLTKVYEENVTETIKVYDLAGNEASQEVKIENIDKEGPAVEGVKDGESYTSVTPTFTEGTATLQKDNGAAEEYTSGTAISEDGTYVLVVTDALGNETEIKFTINNQPIELGGFEEGKDSYKEVMPTFGEGITAMLTKYVDGGDTEESTRAIKSGEQIAIEGSYKLVLTNSAGTTTERTFTIDRTAPEFTTEAKTYNTSVTPAIANSETVTVVSLTRDGEPVEYDALAEISEEGSYVLTVADEAGNEATLRFAIDKTAPTVEGVEDGLSYKTVTPVFEEGTATLKKDSEEAQPFVSGTKIDADGSYVLVVTDSVGNAATINFTIDNTAPEITGVTDDGIYNTSVTPANDAGDADTVELSKDGETVENYTSLAQISEDGDYVLTVKDEAGNVTVIEFTIDTVFNTPELSYNTTKPTQGPVIATIEADEELSEAPEGWSLTDDKMGITKQYTDNTSGAEEVTITDLAGNTAKVEVTVNNIDKTAPEVSGDVNYTENKEGEPGSEVLQSVTVKITANEKIQLPEGWAYEDEEAQTTIVKTYTANNEEEVVLVDLAGNEIKTPVKVTVNQFPQAEETTEPTE